MPQDAFTLKYLCEELNGILKGGNINRICIPDSDSVIMTVFVGSGTKKLFISSNPSLPRISIIEEEKDSILTSTNFLMLLKKHLLSSRLKGIALVGFDRIVKLDFISSGEFSNGEIKSLYVELMGRYSNIILTENGLVLGANRGVNTAFDAVRPLIVGKEYKFPPDNGKLIPSDCGLKEKLQEYNGEDLALFITGRVQGLATSTAKEIAKIFNDKFGEYSGDKRKELYDVINEYCYNVKISPCLIRDDKKVIDFCLYPYATQSGKVIPYKNIYLAECDYFNGIESGRNFLKKKESILAVLLNQVKRAKKKYNLHLAKIKDGENAAEYKTIGELLLSNIYKIENGAKSCKLFNYYDNSEITVNLDENLSVAKNAEKYFKKYNKCKRTLIMTEPLMTEAQKELEYYEGLYDLAYLSETEEELFAITTELEQAGVIKENRKVKKKEKSAEYRTYLIDGFTVNVGRNNIENERLTFTANSEDIWIHAKDYHSAHLIIRSEGKQVGQETLIKACEICAYYSKGREGGKTEVVYTQKKNVKKPPKSKTGFVSYTDFKSLTVIPNRHDEFVKNGIST